MAAALRVKGDARRRDEGIWEWMERQPPGSRGFHCCQVTQKWVSGFPETKRGDLLGRLRSKDDVHAHGAFFELYLFTLLRQTLEESHIDIVEECGGSCPDFVIRKGGRDRCYIEATVFRDVEAEEATGFESMEILREVGRKVEITGWRLWVDHVVEGQREPSKQRLGAQIRRWLATLDRAQVLSVLEAASEDRRPGLQLALLPASDITDIPSGWVFSLRALPLNDPDARAVSLPLNDGNSSVFSSRSAERLGDAIRGKQKQHSGASLPLVVAACCNHWPGEPEQEDVEEALLGTRYGVFNRAGDLIESKRQPNGVWTSPGSAQERVVGVISASCCLPWMVPNEHLLLWDNPLVDAAMRMPEWPFTRRSWNMETRKPEVSVGRDPKELARTLGFDA